MKIIVSPRAKKQLQKLPRFDQIAVTKKIILLSAPNNNEEKLSGFSFVYRVRVGEYRIVYNKTSESIYVFLIGHRKDIYRKLVALLK